MQGAKLRPTTLAGSASSTATSLGVASMRNKCCGAAGALAALAVTCTHRRAMRRVLALAASAVSAEASSSPLNGPASRHRVPGGGGGGAGVGAKTTADATAATDAADAGSAAEALASAAADAEAASAGALLGALAGPAWSADGAALSTLVREDLARWREVVRSAGLSVS